MALSGRAKGLYRACFTPAIHIWGDEHRSVVPIAVVNLEWKEEQQEELILILRTSRHSITRLLSRLVGSVMVLVKQKMWFLGFLCLRVEIRYERNLEHQDREILFGLCNRWPYKTQPPVVHSGP